MTGVDGGHAERDEQVALSGAGQTDEAERIAASLSRFSPAARSAGSGGTVEAVRLRHLLTGVSAGDGAIEGVVARSCHMWGADGALKMWRKM